MHTKILKASSINIFAVVLFAVFSFALPGVVKADNFSNGAIQKSAESQAANQASTKANATNCASGTKDPLSAECTDTCANSSDSNACLKNSSFYKLLVTVINVISGLAALVITMMIIIGGIQYITAGPNANAVGAAKKRITGAIVALLFFLFMWSAINWLTPGGVFNGK